MEKSKNSLKCSCCSTMTAILWPDILFPGVRKKKLKTEHEYLPSIHRKGTVGWFVLIPANIASFLFIAGTDLLLHLESFPTSVLMCPMRWLLCVPTNGEGQCYMAVVSEQIALGKIPCSPRQENVR